VRRRAIRRRLAPAATFVLLAAACATFPFDPGSLSLEEKVGQLFVVTGNAVFVNAESPEFAELSRWVRDDRVGGVHWYQSDVYAAAWLNRRLQAMAKVPLLVSADLEAGTGMRFGGATLWPWPMAVAASGDPELARRQARAVGEEARALGLNQVDAPVADVNADPDNPIINVRSYGENPEEVAKFVAAFVDGLQSAGVIATVKHFPGHGDTRSDSHRSLPLLSVSRERLEQLELVPFRAAIAAGTRAVMTAHLSVPALDAAPAPLRPDRGEENRFSDDPSEAARDATVPASLSPGATEGLLRGELGFGGLVVTDAADMGALVDHYDAGETAVRAILAGADQIPKSPDLPAAIEAVRRAVESGRISRERLDRSVARILEAKRWAGAPVPDPDRIFRIVDSPAHRALAEEIARRSLTLVREGTGALPLRPNERLLVVTVTDAPERIGADFARELRRRLDDPPRFLGLDARTSEAEVASLLEAAKSADAVVAAIYLRVQTARGSIALPPAASAGLRRLLASGARVLGVSFGTPYVLRDLPGLRTYLVAWGSQTDAQVAAARALFGEIDIGGRLPVTIPGAAARGTGIRKPAEKRS
jgi:beta-N-acetylhexosaminidase